MLVWYPKSKSCTMGQTEHYRSHNSSCLWWFICIIMYFVSFSRCTISYARNTSRTKQYIRLNKMNKLLDNNMEFCFIVLIKVNVLLIVSKKSAYLSDVVLNFQVKNESSAYILNKRRFLSNFLLSLRQHYIHIEIRYIRN